MAILIQREARHRAACVRLCRTLLAVAIACSASGLANAAEPQAESLELQVKAAFVYNFAKFVEWPGDSGAAGAGSITFCVFGSEPLYGTLEQSLNGKTINGRPLVARQIGSPQGAQPCNIAFIGASEKRRLGALLDALAGAGVVTVGDFDLFAQRGGMIQLIKEENKFRFAINIDAVNRNGLRISSKLLQLAELVRHSAEARKKP